MGGFGGGGKRRRGNSKSITDSPLEQILLPQVIEVAFQEAPGAPPPPPQCQTPTYFGARAGSPGSAGGRVAPPSERHLSVALLPPRAPLPPAAPWGLWGEGV